MRPPVGVACRECSQVKGHFCQAQIFIDGDDSGLLSPPTPLCLPCADGEPCTVDRVGKPPAPDEIPLFEPESGHVAVAPVIHRTPEELGVARTVAHVEPEDAQPADYRMQRAVAQKLHDAVERRRKGLPAVRVVRARHKVQPIVKEIAAEPVVMSPHAVMGAEMLNPEARSGTMEDVRQEILKYAGKMTDAEAGAKCGVSGSRVGQIRKECGIAAFNAAPGPKPVKSKKATAKKDALALHPGQQTVAIGVGESAAVDALIEDVKFEVRMTLAEARRRLDVLTPAQMGIALRAVMEAELQR